MRVRDVVAVAFVLVLFLIVAARYIPLVRQEIVYYNPIPLNALDYYRAEKEVQGANFVPVQQGSTPAHSVTVLVYHGILEEETNSTYRLQKERFKEHMFALHEHGYQTITQDDLYAFLQGKKELPKKSIMITFDDGIKSSYYNTDPVLKALGYNAVMFAITQHTVEQNSKYYLDVQELQKMIASKRWQVQSHSHNGHFYVPTSPKGDLAPFYGNKIWLTNESRYETDEEFKDRITTDIAHSKEVLETTYNLPVKGFALPFGAFGQWVSNYDGASTVVMKSLETAGYKLVYYQFKPARDKDFRSNYVDPSKDFYQVMRISADDLETDDLLEEVEAAEALDLPYHETFENWKQWVNIWGAVSVENNTVTIKNSLNSSGAMSYLDGSYWWKNYKYSVNTTVGVLAKPMLIARFQNSENYVACVFESNQVSILSVMNNTKQTIAQRPHLYNSNVQDQLSITVKGDRVNCGINNNIIVETFGKAIPDQGGVGIRFEDPAVQKKQLVLVGIEVSQAY